MSGGGDRKHGRNVKHQAKMYKAECRLEANRKRRMRRHLRNNPNDEAGISFFEREIGKFDSSNLLSKGRKLLRKAA